MECYLVEAKKALTSPSHSQGDDQDGPALFSSQEADPQADRGEVCTPYIDYKRLAIEVARQIAPDLQEALEHTLQASMGKIQNLLNAHSSRMEELEQRLECLNATLESTAAGRTPGRPRKTLPRQQPTHRSGERRTLRGVNLLKITCSCQKVSTEDWGTPLSMI